MIEAHEPLDDAIDRVAARLTTPPAGLPVAAVVAALPRRERGHAVRPGLAAGLAVAALLAALWLVRPRDPAPAPASAPASVPAVLETAGRAPFVPLAPPQARVAAPGARRAGIARQARAGVIAIDRQAALPPADSSRALPALATPAPIVIDPLAPPALAPAPMVDAVPLALDPLPLGALRPGSQEQER